MGWCSDKRDESAGDKTPSPTRPNARLVHLAARGNLERVREMLKRGLDPSEQKPDGTSALHAAALQGHVLIALLLIESGANVNLADVYGHRPLLEAARHGSVEMIRLLLQHGADITLTSYQDVSVLMRACAEGHALAAQILLDHAADPLHTAARDGDHALSLAARGGHEECVSLLMGHGVPADFRTGRGGSTALIASVVHGQTACARTLLDHGADPNATDATGQPVIMHAASNGHLECLQVICDASADVNLAGPAGGTALLVACMRGHAKCARVLCAYGAAHGVDEMETARSHGHEELASWLTGARNWASPLHHMAALSRERVRDELRRGANLHLRACSAAPSALEIAHSIVDGSPEGGSGESSVEFSGAPLVLQAALPWSKETHVLWPRPHRQWAAAVLRLSLHLAWQHPERAPLAEVWLRIVMPLALCRTTPPCGALTASAFASWGSTTSGDTNGSEGSASGASAAPFAARHTFSSLPPELVVRVLARLNTADLGRTSCVSSEFGLEPAADGGGGGPSLVQQSLVQQALRLRASERGVSLPAAPPRGERSCVSWLCWEERRRQQQQWSGLDGTASVAAGAANSKWSACVVRGRVFVVGGEDDEPGSGPSSPASPRASAAYSSPRTSRSEEELEKPQEVCLDSLGQGGGGWMIPACLHATAVDQVAIGFEHLLVLSARGQLYSWGKNLFGQLGHGTCLSVGTPLHMSEPQRIEVLEGHRVLEVAAGAFHSMAIVEGRGGTSWVHSWGFGGDCALGHGKEDDEHQPRAVRCADASAASMGSVAAGVRHSLSLSRSGKVWSWGHGSSGELGVDGVHESATPLPIRTLEEVRIRAIAAGDQHSLAIDIDGQLWDWGLKLWGPITREQLAAQPPAIPRRVPLQGMRVRAVAAGRLHSMALTMDGQVLTWGQDPSRTGKLGHGDERHVLTPMRVPELDGVAAVAASTNHSLAIAAEANVLWGWGASANLGGADDEDDEGYDTPRVLFNGLGGIVQ